jgi:hypothetical protein
MNAKDEIALAEFFNESGQLFSPARTSAWPPPSRVELKHGRLTIWGTRTDQPLKDHQLVHPGPGVLESFLALADASAQRLPLSSIVNRNVGEPSCHKKIHRFAMRYGGLQVFYDLERGCTWRQTVHTEYCAVWQYLAGVMRSLLRISAAQYHGESGSQEDWQTVSTPPSVMRTMAREEERCWFDPMPLGDEKNWLALTYFAGKKHEQNHVLVGRLLNTLLGLGRVRPWLTWPERACVGARPEFTYTSRSLLSHLALQLCLRISRVEAFVLCFHCGRSYLPQVRGPKTGQRSFCTDCRKQGMPKYYAHRDFRQRKRARLGAESSSNADA